MSPTLRRFLIPFLVVDTIFFLAVGAWLLRLRFGFGKPDIQIELRHPESKLTEIDLINKGTGAGSVYISVNASWADAELADAKGLSHFEEIDNGRYGIRFYPQASLSNTTLPPNTPWAVGWIKLTDDVPVHAEISTDVTTQP